MQGHNGSIGSLPEILAMDHGSSSSDSGVVEQKINWTNFIQNPPVNGQESQTLTMWNMGESSSSPVPNPVSQNSVDPKTEHEWSTLMKTRYEPHQHEPPVNSSNLIAIKPSSFATSSSSDPLLTRKRKATELSIGQTSSGIESSTVFQRSDGGTDTWRSVIGNPPPLDSIRSDQIIPRLGLGVREGSSDNRVVENNRRNVRIRINNSQQHDLLPVVNNSNNTNNNNQSNLLSLNPSLGLNLVNLRSTVENSSSQIGQNLLREQAMRRNLQASTRIRSSSSRSNRLSNISDHPLFVQSREMQNASQTAINWNLNSGDGNRNGNVTNTGIGNGVSVPNLVPHRGSSHYSSRRLSEVLRRSLLSSVDSGGIGGGQNGNLFSRIPPPVGISGIPPGIGIVGHRQVAHSRSSDTQIDGAFGSPFLARTVGGGSERRGRLAAEIRNVLDLIRRGEGLPMEDVMILDQSVFYGMAGIHDRHRDMRLDIDNMSYEELLALEERIGNVNTGLTEENISNCLKQTTFATVPGQPDAEPCCICQEEFKNGDDMGGLECGHGFHTNCIKQWLLQKNSCPVCKSAATKK